MIIFFNRIPFVYRDDDRLACFMGIACNMLVLFPDTGFRIDQKDRNIT